MKCPACNKNSIPSSKILFASRHSRMECQSCGARLKISDKAIDFNNMVLQFLLVLMWVVAIFFLFVAYGVVLSVVFGFIILIIFYLLCISFYFIFPLEVDDLAINNKNYF